MTERMHLCTCLFVHHLVFNYGDAKKRNTEPCSQRAWQQTRKTIWCHKFLWWMIYRGDTKEKILTWVGQKKLFTDVRWVLGNENNSQVFITIQNWLENLQSKFKVKPWKSLKVWTMLLYENHTSIWENWMNTNWRWLANISQTKLKCHP